MWQDFLQQDLIFKLSQYRKNLKGLDNKMCQWPNLSQDILEMCLQGSWKPGLFILTWNMIHMLHTTCVRIDLMKFYSLNSTFCLFVPLSRLLLHKSWSIPWCLRRKICESRVREVIINSWETILTFCFQCFSSWHMTVLKRTAIFALFSLSSTVCYQTSFSVHYNKSNVIQHKESLTENFYTFNFNPNLS